MFRVLRTYDNLKAIPIQQDVFIELKLRQASCIVSKTAAAQLETSDGAPYRVKIYRIKMDLHYVNGGEKVSVDQHQNLTTSRESPLTHTYRLRELSCSYN